MFEAMQAGAGTLSTTHSHSAASTMDTEPPSAELTERVRGQFRARGLTVY